MKETHTTMFSTPEFRELMSSGRIHDVLDLQELQRERAELLETFLRSVGATPDTHVLVQQTTFTDDGIVTHYSVERNRR